MKERDYRNSRRLRNFKRKSKLETTEAHTQGSLKEALTCRYASLDQHGNPICFYNYDCIGLCRLKTCPKRVRLQIPIATLKPESLEDALIDKIWSLFVNRSDCYAEQLPDGSYNLIKEPLTKEIIKQHLRGEKTIGIYQISPMDNTVKWALYDLDVENPTAEQLNLLRKDVAKIVEKLTAKILFSSILIEFSGSKGYHVWTFFDPSIPAIVANKLLRNISDQAEVRVKEVFPKQSQVSGKGFGNLVKLPLGIHQVSKKRSQLLIPPSKPGEDWKPLDSTYLLNVNPVITDPKEIAVIRDKIKREESGWMEKLQSSGLPYLGEDPPCVKSYLQGGLGPGERDPVGVQLASYLLNFKGMKETPEKQQQALEILLEWNERNCPPHSAEKVKEAMFKQALTGKYNYGCDHVDGIWKKRCILQECPVRKNTLPILLGEFSEEALEKAKRFLTDPAGFIQHLQQCFEYRLTGEWANRLFMFLGGVGARIKTSIIRLYGPNAVGKKMLYYWMPEFFVEDDVVIMSSQTAPWLKRMVAAGFDTRGKIFIVIEERGDFKGQVKYEMEQIYSEDKIKVGFNIRGESGDWEPIQVTLQGPLTYITTATETEESLHGKTREWEVNPDESKEQTERVALWYKWREHLPLSVLEQERKDIEVIRAYLSLLKDYKDIRVPFISKIQFPMKSLEDRRKLPDFTNLSRFAAYLFQNVCPRHEEKSVLFAAPFIFDIVNIISKDIVATSRGSLNAGEKKLFKWIEARKTTLLSVTKKGAEPKTVHTLKEGSYTEPAEAFTVTDIIEHPDYSQQELGNRKTIQEKLKALASKGWISNFVPASQGKQAIYGFRSLGNKLITKSNGSETDSVCLKEPVSEEFLNLVTSHVLNGVPPTHSGVTKLPSEIKPENMLFQPEWGGIEAIENGIQLKRALKEIKEEGVG